MSWRMINQNVQILFLFWPKKNPVWKNGLGNYSLYWFDAVVDCSGLKLFRKKNRQPFRNFNEHFSLLQPSMRISQFGVSLKKISKIFFCSILKKSHHFFLGLGAWCWYSPIWPVLLLEIFSKFLLPFPSHIGWIFVCSFQSSGTERTSEPKKKLNETRGKYWHKTILNWLNWTEKLNS